MDKIVASPYVSILFPVFNAERYLSEAINSILNQTFKNFELLLINDGSTDGSRSIILSYEDSRIRYVENDTNLKLIRTLNKGLKLSRGKYIARMDADDIAYPTRLERQVTFMQANPKVGACGSWMRTSDNSVISYPIEYEDIKIQLLKKNAVGHPTAMVRKEVLTDNGICYQENFLHVEDYELWTRISMVTQLHNIPEVLLTYRIHHEQVSKRHAKVQRKNNIKVRVNLLANSFPCVYSYERNLLTSVMEEQFLSVRDFFKFDSLIKKISYMNRKSSLYKRNEFQEYLESLWVKGVNSVKPYSLRFVYFVLKKSIYRHNIKFALKLTMKYVASRNSV